MLFGDIILQICILYRSVPSPKKNIPFGDPHEICNFVPNCICINLISRSPCAFWRWNFATQTVYKTRLFSLRAWHNLWLKEGFLRWVDESMEYPITSQRLKAKPKIPQESPGNILTCAVCLAKALAPPAVCKAKPCSIKSYAVKERDEDGQCLFQLLDPG